MKLPTHCPKCHDVLLNLEVFDMLLPGTWKKVCNLRLDHQLSYFYNPNTSEVIFFFMKLSDKIEICWDFKYRTIRFSNPHESTKKLLSKLLSKTGSIPFFEPNPYKYEILISKLKTYILFS